MGGEVAHSPHREQSDDGERSDHGRGHELPSSRTERGHARREQAGEAEHDQRYDSRGVPQREPGCGLVEGLEQRTVRARVVVRPGTDANHSAHDDERNEVRAVTPTQRTCDRECKDRNREAHEDDESVVEVVRCLVDREAEGVTAVEDPIADPPEDIRR